MENYNQTLKSRAIPGFVFRVYLKFIIIDIYMAEFYLHRTEEVCNFV